MESQTVTLILGAIVVLVIVNFLFLDDSSSSGSDHGRSRRNVVVTGTMVDSVRAVAPGLTTAQIRADLQETGSVQLTVERYLSGALVATESDTDAGSSTGTERASCGPAGTSRNGRGVSTKSGASGGGGGVFGKGQDGPFGGLTFDEKKQEMIAKNRRRLGEKKGCEFVLR